MTGSARTRRAALAGVLAAPAMVVAAPAGALPATASTGNARLAGKFLLLGIVTVARDVPGERVGQRALRHWTFIASCATGPCRSVILRRERAHGTDILSLRRRAPGRYVGRGRFYAPLRCGSRTYRSGAVVPFSVSVQVTAATGPAGARVATRVNASYTNLRRTNLTSCVTALGHDAARYHGHLLKAGRTI